MGFRRLGGIAAIALTLAAPAEAAYTITDLGLRCQPADITDAGAIVGSCKVPGSVYDMASLWTGAGWMALGTLGGVESQATAISNVGRIVGRAQTATGAWRAFRTKPYGAIAPADDLGTLPGDIESRANDINETGEVVGASLGSSWRPVAYRNGAWVDLGSLGGSSGEANAINAGGWVVGSSTNQWGTPFGFRSAPAALINSATDTLGFVNVGSGGVGVNDAGYAVGVGYPNGATHEAMMWAPNGRPFYLGTLPSLPAARAEALTSWLQVVGYGWGPSGWSNMYRPFVWSRGRMSDLNDLIPRYSGWLLETAFDINERGQIVGTGVFNGYWHGYLLSDNAPPVVTCAQPAPGWHGANVTVACTSTDAESGLQSLADASFSLSTIVPAGTVNANASTVPRKVCDHAGNCVTHAVGGIKIDLEAPVVTLKAPAAGEHLVNASVVASYGCADTGSGIAACSGPVADGAPVDTSSVGAATFTVTAVDVAGNAATSTVAYHVRYGWIQVSSAKGGLLEIDLVDANGQDLSDPSVQVLLLSVDDPRIAYDDPFAYTSGGTYVYDLSRFGSGSHDVWFSIGDDLEPYHTKVTLA